MMTGEAKVTRTKEKKTHQIGGKRKIHCYSPENDHTMNEGEAVLEGIRVSKSA